MLTQECAQSQRPVRGRLLLYRESDLEGTAFIVGKRGEPLT